MRVGPIEARFWLGHRDGWVRVAGYGLAIRDHRRHRPLWSERNTTQPWRYRHVGSWCVAVLLPDKKSRSGGVS